MHFVMTIGEKIIERIEVRRDLARDEEYLLALQNMLSDKHWLLIAAYQREPNFYLQVAASQNNESAGTS